MRQRLWFASRLAFATLILCASSASAQTVAVGPYYATPSWDQTIPGATRFVVLSNFNSDAVLDRETGLVWLRAPLAPASQFVAWVTCANSTTGSRSGWRLPTMPEVQSLLDPTQFSPAGGPPAVASPNPFSLSGVLNPLVRTSTADAGGAGDGGHMAVDIVGGAIFSVADFNSNTVWCVRGARIVDNAF